MIVYHNNKNKNLVMGKIKTKYKGNTMIYHDKCEFRKYGVQVSIDIISAH